MLLPHLIAALAAAAVLPPSGEISGKVVVHKKDGSDKGDHSDVVIYVADIAAPVSGVRAEIKQRDRQFSPRVLAIAAGTTVAFPNADPIEHNVFSHSASAEFDFGRYGPGAGKSRAFPTPGVVEIFCNVHQEMVSYIVVAPSAAFAITGPDGSFSIKRIPAGRHQLVVWERFARPRVQSIFVDVPPGGSAQVALEVSEKVESEEPHQNKFGVTYSTVYK